jgi:hypothetical protein
VEVMVPSYTEGKGTIGLRHRFIDPGGYAWIKLQCIMCAAMLSTCGNEELATVKCTTKGFDQATSTVTLGPGTINRVIEPAENDLSHRDGGK